MSHIHTDRHSDRRTYYIYQNFDLVLVPLCLSHSHHPHPLRTSQMDVPLEYCTRWAEGYLRLMVNSRDELAMARVLCGPFGVLDEAAFKIVRREAEKTKMPIYQV